MRLYKVEIELKVLVGHDTRNAVAAQRDAYFAASSMSEALDMARVAIRGIQAVIKGESRAEILSCELISINVGEFRYD